MRSLTICFIGLLLFPVAGCETQSNSSAEPTTKAPSTSFTFTTDTAFDPSSIPPYSGNSEEIYGYIGRNLDAHIANLQRWMRQPSISAQNEGISEMAEMVRSDLEALGFSETAVVPTSGHPGVWGYYDAGAEKTLVLYMMYDVQPVNPEDWESPPFEANLIENELGTIMMARGATNQKGPQRAFLNAIESVIAIDGTLPVNLMVLAEGEEELGSPHYPELVDQFEERMREADGVFFPFNSQDPQGEISMFLGVKGIVYWELEALGGAWGGPSKAEIHGSYKALVDSPVLRLTQAIASMTTPDGNTILIDGYYDDVQAPTEEEQELINGLVANWSETESKQKELLGVERWIDDLSGREAILRYLYDVTLNVDGIWGGYTGEGVKTILPHKATAKMDSRLPATIDPDKALQLIRTHLDSHGFEDLEIRKLSGYPAARSSIDAPLVQAAIGVFNKWRETKEVWPRLAGSAPFYQFTERLDIPLVFNGLGHGSGAHAPNEYMVIHPAPGSSIAGLAEIEKSYVDLLYALAASE